MFVGCAGLCSCWQMLCWLFNGWKKQVTHMVGPTGVDNAQCFCYFYNVDSFDEVVDDFDDADDAVGAVVVVPVVQWLEKSR